VITARTSHQQLKHRSSVYLRHVPFNIRVFSSRTRSWLLMRSYGFRRVQTSRLAPIINWFEPYESEELMNPPAETRLCLWRAQQNKRPCARPAFSSSILLVSQLDRCGIFVFNWERMSTANWKWLMCVFVLPESKAPTRADIITPPSLKRAWTRCVCARVRRPDGGISIFIINRPNYVFVRWHFTKRFISLCRL